MKSEDYAQGDAFQTEKRSIFSTGWLPACAEAQIPKAGDFVSLTVGGWSVIVTRDPAGAITVLRNMCRHQAMPVVGVPAGNCETFRCRFHGWTFDLTGKFLGAPPPVAPREASANHNLIALPMLIEAGIVFFSLTLAIEVRLFSTTKYRLTSWWANRFRASIDGTSDSKDEDEDVAIERKRVLEAGVSDDVLVSSASQCHRSAYSVSSQCRSST